jgi:tetratricopeptide (TPR) repeat protein
VESKATYERALGLVGTQTSDRRTWLTTNYAVSLWHLGPESADDARKNFELAYRSSAPSSLTRALVAQNFGSFLWDLDELSSAETKLREADSIYSELELSKQFLKSETLNDLGGVLLALGQYEESRRYLEASRSEISDKMGTSTLSYAQTTANLIANRSRFGDASAAEDDVSFLLKRETEGNLLGFELGSILGAVSEYFSERMDFGKSKEVLKRAYGILSRIEDNGAAKVLRGKIAMKQIEALLDEGSVEAANLEFSQNTNLLSETVRASTRGEMQLERIRGRLHLARKEWDDAIAHLQRSIAVGHAVLGPDHPNLVWSLTPLANSYLGGHKGADASSAIVEAKRIAGKWLSAGSRIWPQLTTLSKTADQLLAGAATRDKS